MAERKRIPDDETYNRSLSWLVQKSIELSDPLLSPEKREKLQQNYDYVADTVQRYRRGQMILEYPGLQTQYDALGWKYDLPDDLPEQSPTPSTPEQPKEQEPEQPKRSALAAWLDDE